jgi:ABC-2 type transport system ATP-binding protein
MSMLELVGLRKRFGDVAALDGCSFQVRPGRVLGFLGRNGAGKTTAMRSIFGLVRLDGGQVQWDGRPVAQADRLAFGYMPEERGLYPRMRIRDQLVYFGRLRGMDASAAHREADRWLDRLDLGDRAEAALDTLSHGNQQRVQLGVSLIGEPELLVLDEPFSGLDPIASTTLSEVIGEEARRGAAVVFSSHQLDLVEDVCDDIAIITRGKVVVSGALDDIRRQAPTRYVDFGLERPVTPAEVETLADSLSGIAEPPGTDGVRMQLPATTDPAAVLSAVGRLGAVQHFRFEPPSLADLFHEAVGE